MKRIRLGTRITIWSAVVVIFGILACGMVSTLYVTAAGTQ